MTKGRTCLGFPSSRLRGLGLIVKGQDAPASAGVEKVKVVGSNACPGQDGGWLSGVPLFLTPLFFFLSLLLFVFPEGSGKTCKCVTSSIFSPRFLGFLTPQNPQGVSLATAQLGEFWGWGRSQAGKHQGPNSPTQTQAGRAIRPKSSWPELMSTPPLPSAGTSPTCGACTQLCG